MLLRLGAVERAKCQVKETFLRLNLFIQAWETIFVIVVTGNIISSFSNLFMQSTP